MELRPTTRRSAQHVSNAQTDEVDLREVMVTVWRGKFWVVLSGFLGLVLASYYLLMVFVPVYTSNATVALESRQDQVVDLESVVSGLAGDQATINTEVEVIRSRGLIAQLVKDLELINDQEFNERLRVPSPFSLSHLAALAKDALLGTATDMPNFETDETAIQDAVIDAVLSQITVTNIRQSYVFRISAVTQSAQKSALIANRLAELYIRDQIAVKFEKTAQATEWLSRRVTDLQIELETADAALKEYSNNTDLISPEGLIALNRQLKDLRDRDADLDVGVQVASTRLEDLRQLRQTGDIGSLAIALGDGGQVASEANVLTRFDQLLSRARIERDRAVTQRDTIATSMDEIARRIEMQSSELVQLQQLQREAEASRLIYEYFLTRLKETAVQQGIQQADSRILSGAVVPLDPSAPRKPVILTLSLVLGIFSGTALILLHEFSQNTFRVAEDLEVKTGYPVLGQIPEVPAKRRKKVQDYLKNKPNSAAAEAIRNLRTSLLLANLDKTPKVIMSTSSIPGEGKTTQSIALAQNLGDMGKKVLLIEGDIRRCVFKEYFSITNEQGLLSVLLGDVPITDALTRVPEHNFDILMGEKPTTNAADIFSSARFADFLQGLRDTYDHVIIDTPPVLAVTDARIIGLCVDAVIYAVKWDSTTHRQVTDGLKALEQVNVRISGLVLGQISARGMKRYGYGDSYGAYQAYYQS